MRGIFVSAVAAGILMSGGTAFAACTATQPIGSIQLSRGGPLGGLLMPVAINGTAKQMVLDTSAGFTLVTPEAMAELKLPLREERTSTASSNQSSGYSVADDRRDQAKIDTLILGNAGQFTNNAFLIDDPLPGGDVRPATAPAGSIGLDILTHFDFDFDFASDTMGMFRTDHCDGQVVYWKTSGAVAIPFRYDNNGRIAFTVTLDGVKLTAVLDTSRARDEANLDVLRDRLKFDETAPDVEQLAARDDGAQVWRHRFKTLDLGGVGIQNPEILVAQDKLRQKLNSRNTAQLGSSVRDTELNRQPDLRLGLSTLAKLHVYVAVKEKKIYLSPAGQ